MYDTAIYGAGPAGLSAALYTLRKNMKTALISKDIGGQVITTWDVENYPGFKKIGGYDLSKKMEEQITQFPIALDEGVSLVKLEKKSVFEAHLDNGKVLKSKTVILALGKKYQELGVKGEKKFTGKGVSYCSTCDAPLFKNKTTVVAGGGNAAAEALLELSKIASKVYAVIRKEHFRADPVLIQKIEETKNIEILFNHSIQEISGNEFVEKVMIQKKDTNEVKTLETDAVFVEIGLVPNTSFECVPSLTINDQKEIRVNNKGETNIKGLFAAGDVTDIPEKQIVIAAGEGAKAALSAFRYLQNQ
ncbi:MAG: hypothetical protein A2Y41_01830 [Spirochaetes bacterium GWB1_36_13]|nr:MAG: hypothetical protein A2Y41_01830 [Spirochaetes bacterium GWB1_36_13]